MGLNPAPNVVIGSHMSSPRYQLATRALHLGAPRRRFAAALLVGAPRRRFAAALLGHWLLRLSWLAAAGTALLAPPTAQADVSDEQRIRVAERLKQSTVTVIAGQSTGSGFVSPTRGWIVTNAHVASGARWTGRLKLRFGDGSTRGARLIAYDAHHDLAVAEVDEPHKVPALPLADSDDVKVGQTVLAFGSPFGLEGTLTQGIVSARRDLAAIGAGDLHAVIQTDAPINPGNSGGPLVNAKGEVVGVNTAIVSRSGSSAGIGFAVPANYVKELLSALEREVKGEERVAGAGGRDLAAKAPVANKGAATSAPVWLGLLGRDYRGHGYAGVRVQQVAPNSPAAEAGLLGAVDHAPPFIEQLGVPWTGHIILAVDSHPVRSMKELQKVLASHRPGDQAVITVTVGPGILTGETVVELGAPPTPEPAR
jgi:S1-C subfamily serine protease